MHRKVGQQYFTQDASTIQKQESEMQSTRDADEDADNDSVIMESEMQSTRDADEDAYIDSLILEIYLEDEDEVERILKETSVKVNAKDKDGNIPLHIAAKEDNFNIFKLLLKANSETDTINSTNMKGKTPLHLAAKYNHVEMAKMLIENHADINIKDNDGLTPLLVAASYGRPQVVDMLLQENANLDVKDKQGKTIVYLATENNHLDVLNILFNVEDNTLLTKIKGMLNIAVGETELSREDESWRSWLDEDSLSIDSDYARTPVQIAAYHGYLECMNLLVKNGADVSMTCKLGKTALHLAAAQGNAGVVKQLLKEDKTLRDKADDNTNTALHDAIANDKIVAILIQAGANVNAKNDDKRTPISIATEKGLVGSTKILLNHDADTNLADKFKRKPIHYAAENGHSEVFRILASHKNTKFTERDDCGYNVLALAIENNHVETVLTMFQMGSRKWEDMMRVEWFGFDSPMRTLIRDMPDVAREVFNRCVKIKGSGESFEVEFNYEFLDDTFHLGNWNKDDNNHKIDNDDEDANEEGGANDDGDANSDGDDITDDDAECIGDDIDRGKKVKDKPYTDDLNLIKANHPLMIMVTSKRTELLDHPLVSALLKKKWSGVSLMIHLLNFLLYAVYLAMLTGFALDIKAPFQFRNVSADTMNVCSEDNGAHYSIPEFASYAKYAVIVIASIELLIEMLEMKQMFSCKVWLYFLEVENVIEWITCVTAIIFVVNTNGCSDTGFRPQWQWTCGTISVFLAWINMLFIIQKFEWFGIYVVMLYRILKVFMKFFLVFSFLIVAFAVSFHSLFQNQEQFSTVWISLVKTTAMMIGELDFGTIFLDEVVHYEYISYMFFYSFMILMTIVVINLLVGLAVENIQEFQKEADLAKKEMQVKFALEFERISTSSLFLKGLNFLRCNRSAKNVSKTETLRPNEQSWLQRKFAESWKLTEKDIKVALRSEKDGTSKEIARLETKFNTLETNMTDMDLKLERILQTLSRVEEKCRKLENN